MSSEGLFFLMCTGSCEELYIQFQRQLKLDRVLGQQAVQQAIGLQNTIEAWEGVCKKLRVGHAKQLQVEQESFKKK